MRQPNEINGFESGSSRERRNVALVKLMTTIALAVCTLVAGTAIFAGIARAETARSAVDHENGLFALALMLGLFFTVMGGVNAIPSQSRKDRRS